MKSMSKSECKSEMMRILKYIDEIAQKNNINYTLIGGSLIGALRNNGIIPWDDDIDIGLTYDNYKQLIELIEKDGNKDFKLIYYENNESCYFPHTKIVSTRTYLKEKDFQEIDGMGVFVDIFIYMHLPNDEKNRKRFYNKLTTINKIIYSLRKPNKHEEKFVIKYIRFFVANCILGKKRLFRAARKLYTKYNNTDYVVVNLPHYGYSKEIQSIKCFDGYCKHIFEGEQIQIINNYDMMLKTTFGDYMTPPPEDKRENHELTAYWRNDEK